MKKYVLAILLVIVLSLVLISENHDELAKCITDKGAKFYGTFWCPHCAEQKQIFGSSIKYVDYIECSTKDKQQRPLCTQQGIETYPTWVFEGGQKINAVLSLDELAEKTGCE
tara:strand:- start:222 stop:557 length:336 start_codon:yes stop_codon:yes gene_type:complete